ncbi:MAG: CRTAC1 family protein [Methylococcaceae bacterium]|nr:CRTAC1 family protein [Methylococcaceae bacterium]
MQRLSFVLLLSIAQASTQAAEQTELANPLNDLIGEIQELENKRDPKCYATTSRLEDFMYGTPLSSTARFTKIDLQKSLLLELWQQASTAAKNKGSANIKLEILSPILQKHLAYSEQANGDWQVTLPNNTQLTISQRDKRQYSSIAYALRAMLAVQQDILLDPQKSLQPLTEESSKTLQNFLDIVTLSVLQIADQDARLTHQKNISSANINASWKFVMPAISSYLSQQTLAPQKSDFSILKKIIAQKLASYQAYNDVSMQIFTRNLQVYFAKHPWPKEAATGKAFKDLFTEAMIQYTHDLLLGAEKQAIADNQPLIRVANVKQFSDSFIPHQINEYEDAIFFPNLPKNEQISIEAYDMDAFRDSGIHWRYLQFVIDDPKYNGALEPDPFAAELLVENVAQFGVLLLRVTGMVAKREGDERLNPKQIEPALRIIQAKINANTQSRPKTIAEKPLPSSPEVLPANKQQFFTEITQQAGLSFMHRSSDWLNRLIRSYAMKSENVGQLNIPPAFGGSGVAAEDINNDGWVDVLLLSGLGNKLFLNEGNGHFIDITAESGIDWRRADGLAGEPRQAIIADFDNDGLQDIFITYVDDQHRLYKKLGNNHFEDVTAKAGLGGKNLAGGPAVAFDYDNDGLLDIYINYFGDYIHGILPTLARRNTNGLPNKLFHNNGNFEFSDVSAKSGAENSGWGQAATHTDFDRDGWQDLIVGNDFGVNAYYRNKGDGSFENIAEKLGTGKPSYTMNVGISDLNKDLFPDIYISNIVTMNKDEKYVAPNQDTPMKLNPEKLANMRVVEANDLFISQTSKGVLNGYSPSTMVERGYSSTGWSWGADFFDVDNDGDDDLYVANGMNDFNLYSTENPYYTDPLDNQTRNVHLPDSSKESNVFFINANGKLQNMSAQSGANIISNSRSVAYLDYDNDGDLDMLLNNYHEPAVFYRNNAELLAGNWLRIKLIGDPAQKSNRDAIGARIIVTTPSGLQLWREIHSSVGYLTMHPKQQHFGLGKQKTANITIEWPNGQKTQLNNIAINKSYLISQKDQKLQVIANN